MTFVVRKKIELSKLGEDWKDCYIVFTPFTFNDNATLLKFRSIANSGAQDADQAEKVSKEIIALLKSKFVEGKGWDGTKVIPITKDNLAELPMELIGDLLQALQGQSVLPPNA